MENLENDGKTCRIDLPEGFDYLEQYVEETFILAEEINSLDNSSDTFTRPGPVLRPGDDLYFSPRGQTIPTDSDKEEKIQIIKSDFLRRINFELQGLDVEDRQKILKQVDDQFAQLGSKRLEIHHDPKHKIGAEHIEDRQEGFAASIEFAKSQKGGTSVLKASSEAPSSDPPKNESSHPLTDRFMKGFQSRGKPEEPGLEQSPDVPSPPVESTHPLTDRFMESYSSKDNHQDPDPDHSLENDPDLEPDL